MLLVEEEEREGLQEETVPSLLGPRQGGQASDTQRRHLHAMISLLRPEETVKLVRISSTHSCFTTLPFYIQGLQLKHSLYKMNFIITNDWTIHGY